MSPQTNRSPGRLLAPAALVAVFVALVLVVLGSSGSPERRGSEADSGARSTSTSSASPRDRTRRGVYTVKRGDTLGGIAEANDTTVDRLQELNPELDARTLVTGQKIKLEQ